MLTVPGVVAVICLVLLLAVAALFLSEAVGPGGSTERVIARLFPEAGASSARPRHRHGRWSGRPR